MKTVIKVSLIVMMAAGTLQAERLNRYAVQSGKVTYEITGSKEIKALGLKERIKGEKRIVFDAFGDREIEEVKKMTESKSGGKSTLEEEHELTYTDGAQQYRVDFDRKRITKRKNPYYAANYTLVEGKDIQAFMPKAKKAGTETVAGLECTVWKRKKESLCLYKGIILKKYSDDVTTTATRAEFGVALTKNDFRLPDFPMVDKRGKKIVVD